MEMIFRPDSNIFGRDSWNQILIRSDLVKTRVTFSLFARNINSNSYMICLSLNQFSYHFLINSFRGFTKNQLGKPPKFSNVRDINSDKSVIFSVSRWLRATDYENGETTLVASERKPKNFLIDPSWRVESTHNHQASH